MMLGEFARDSVKVHFEPVAEDFRRQLSYEEQALLASSIGDLSANLEVAGSSRPEQLKTAIERHARRMYVSDGHQVYALLVKPNIRVIFKLVESGIVVTELVRLPDDSW